MLRRFRFEAGLSQEALAERARIHRTYLSQVELGKRNPSFETISKILGALGRRWDELGDRLSTEDGQEP